MDITPEIFNDSALGADGVSVSVMDVYPFHTHTHLYYELLLYQPFAGSIRVNERTVSITRPTAVLIAPGDFHSTQLYGKETSPVIKMQCNASKLEIPYSTSLLELSTPGSLIEKLFAAGIQHADAKEYLLSVIRMAAAEITFHGEELAGQASGKARIVSQAMQYINLHFQSNATLSEAANEQHFSEQYLSSVFSETAGITFQNYLIEKRLTFAAALLRSGKYSVTDACYECGYTNLSHFIRSFTRKYGVSPKQFSRER